MLIENDPVEGSDVTPVIDVRVEENHPATDGGMEGTIPLLRRIDALKVKSTVSEVNDIICNMKTKNLDELKNLLRAGIRLICNHVGVVANKKEFKQPYWKR